MRHTIGLSVMAAIAAALLVAGPAVAKPVATPSVVKVTALASGLQYNTKVLRSHPGKIALVFTNLSTTKHNVRIESGENELGGTKTIGKGKAVAYVNLKKGTYNFYCSVPGHEDAGMKGKLVVSS